MWLEGRQAMSEESDMKRIKKTDPQTLRLIEGLKKASREKEAPIWRDIAKRLEKPRRSWAEVNISKISRYAKKGEQVIVPGKLLGSGEIDFPVVVAAVKASRQAEIKIKEAGGDVITIEELMKRNPRGERVRILG